MTAPSTSAAVPRLSLDALPARPRPLHPVLAVSLGVGGDQALIFAMLALTLSPLTLVPALHTDLRDSSADAVTGAGVVVDVRHHHGDSEGSVSAVLIDVDGGGRIVSFVDDGTPLRAALTPRARVALVGERDDVRVRGARERPLDALFVMTGLATLVGLAGCWAYWGVRRGRRHLALLRDGDVARATRSGMERDDRGDDTVYVFTYAFVDVDGRARTATVRTLHEESAAADPEEGVLYDERDAFVLDALPGAPTLVDGRFSPRHPLRAYRLAILGVAGALALVACPLVALVLATR